MPEKIFSFLDKNSIEYFLQFVNQKSKISREDVMIFENIKRIAEDRGKSISAMERELSFGNGTIHSWKCCSPTVNNLKSVADYLDTTIDELMKE